MVNSEKKSKKPKKLYKIELWRRNDDWDPTMPPLTLMTTEYIHSYSAKQALGELKERASLNARTLGRRKDFNLVGMLYSREDISISITQVADEQLDYDTEQMQKEHQDSAVTCQHCGEQLDDDYCQECGWRRPSGLNGKIKVDRQ